jgi:murein L,D-transpeptidase YcbB/YkuD
MKSLLMFCALAGVPAGVAYAQAVQQQQPPLRQAVAQPAAPAAVQPGVPQVQPQPAPAPVPLPPPLWTPADAQELLTFIQQIGSEGLDPVDYDSGGLALALRSGDPVKLSEVATDRFNRVSSDLALGHVRGKGARPGWHITDGDLDEGRQDLLLRTALQQHRVTDALLGLLPTHPQYRDLKNALASTAPGDTAQLNRIRLNMERWRWLPRELGERYIIVNVPAYYVSLVENGTTRWRQKAVAGAIRTPTPMLSVEATGVVLNPSWYVPKSIEPEVRGKAGFVPVKKDGKIVSWRQPPGPNNALGELKFVMYNPHNIYLHDTNARSRFNDKIRSLSHGCIRTQNITELATELLTDGGTEWSAEKVQETLASKKTVTANFPKPLPVYIVYFSSAAKTDGGLVNYQDIYKRDAQLLAALDGKAKTPGAPDKKIATR